MEQWELVNGEFWVHSASDCVPEHPCPLHHPSAHRMWTWPMAIYDLWTDEGWGTPVIHRLCPHGDAHPDPESVAWEFQNYLDVTLSHECDGCCKQPISEVLEELLALEAELA